jgi:hypothetical protein
MLVVLLLGHWLVHQLRLLVVVVVGLVLLVVLLVGILLVSRLVLLVRLVLRMDLGLVPNANLVLGS